MDESNKKAIIGIAAAIVIGAAASGIAYFATESQAYVAKVNGTAIPTSEYEHIFDQTKKQYSSRFGIDFASEQGKQVEKDIKKGIVGQLVERQIIFNEAKKRDVKVEDAKIDEKLAEIKKGFPDETAFVKALNDNGMKLDELKTRIREGLTVEAVTAAVTSDVKVTDDEVKAYYEKNKDLYKKPEEVQASHILVKEEAKAKDLLAQLKKGADFAKLAAENSIDPGSKGQGGDLGFFGRGRMVPEFEKAAFALKPGELSGLVKTQFGYHILKGGEHHEAHTQTFDEVKGEIHDRLTKERQQSEFGKWLNAQKKVASIEYKAEYDPKAAEPQPDPKAADPDSAPKAPADAEDAPAEDAPAEDGHEH